MLEVKRLVSIGLAISLLTTPLAVNAAATKPIKTIIDNKEVTFGDVAPINIKGNILVPVKGIFEKLGATVKWNQATKQVIANKGIKTVTLTIGSKTAVVNEIFTLTYELEVAPVVIKGVTYIPLRFVTESMGGSIRWDSSINTITIISAKDNPYINETTSSPSTTTQVNSSAQANSNNPSIASYIESYTKELMNDMSKFNLNDGKEFSEFFDSTKKIVNAYEAKAIYYNLNASGNNIEVRSTVSNDLNYKQGIKISIDKGNGQFIYGNGSRMIINDHLYLFETDFNDIDTNNYITNTQSKELILLDTIAKKAYSLTSTLYRVEDNSDSDIPVKVTTKVFNYTDDLQESDYASLFVASKSGKYKETNLSVNRKEYVDNYHKILYGFNFQPIYINIDVNRPYIYAYEVLAQIAKPRWDFYSKIAFYRHFEDFQTGSTSPITDQQINDMKAPFE